ncbi:mitochondrial import inner membrane translocase subunit Tim10-like isoform X2 [Convolutriloba macropyga]|uniref:mitochondrial import inner membrane translocase subunit Tim10-like isoform X2 n=1 Tax=Convolutriloba macropyga TaxID=536237 RepID=UPI003F524AF6
MNMFSRSKPQQSSGSGQTEIEVAETMQKLEIEMMTDMYSKLSDTCRTKCVGVEVKEPELTKGEAVCLDRCVAKYMELHDMVGKTLQEKTNPNATQVKTNRTHGQPRNIETTEAQGYSHQA